MPVDIVGLTPVTVVLKNRLYLTPMQSKLIDELMEYYSRACSYGSKRAFNNNTGKSLHKLIYYDIRDLFHLKAQEADSVPRTIEARYRSVNTQLYNTAYKRYKDVYSKKHFYLGKTVNDLWNPIHFHTPQADLVYKNDWRILPKQNRLSINTPDGHKRIKAKFYLPKYFRKYLKMKHRLGTAKLIRRRGKHYLYVGCTVYVKPMKKVKKVIGSDRGLRFICCPFDGAKFRAFKGLSTRKKRAHFLHQRAVLQHKNTEAAKRKLRQLSGQENCWMQNKNHRITKALVQDQKGNIYALENLRGVRFANKDISKHYKYGQVSWAFYEFGQYLSYKANLTQNLVIHVPRQYTSKRCPKCGCVLADSREHGKHIFICKNPHCDYKGNDDFTASKNIRFLAILALLGYTNAAITEDGSISYRHYYIYKTKKHYKLKYLSPSQAIDLVRASHVTNQ